VTVALAGHGDAIRWLCDGKAIHATDTVGNTVLHFAAYRGDKNAVKLLIDLGADKKARNVAGETPADLAKRWGKTENGTLLQ
jgi:ankyrin repeat protein